ncbi:MAG: hypothetical protein ABII08_04450 [Candidatus Beckwithbacteria bacterium]
MNLEVKELDPKYIQQPPTKEELEKLYGAPLPPLDHIGLGVLGMLIKERREKNAGEKL